MTCDSTKPGGVVGHAQEKAAATASNPDKCTQHGLGEMNKPDAPGGVVGHHAKATATPATPAETAAATAAATASAYQTDPAKEMQRQQDELQKRTPKR